MDNLKSKITIGNVITIICMIISLSGTYYKLNSKVDTNNIKINGRIDLIESKDSFQESIINEQKEVIKKNTSALHKLDKTLAILADKANTIRRRELE